MATTVPVVSVMYFFLAAENVFDSEPRFPGDVSEIGDSRGIPVCLGLCSNRKYEENEQNYGVERLRARETRAASKIGHHDPACILGAALARVKTSPTDRVLHRQALRHSSIYSSPNSGPDICCRASLHLQSPNCPLALPIGRAPARFVGRVTGCI